MKLSVLDQAVIRKGDSPGDALKQTSHLAQIADNLGYTRFWTAEHHNSNGMAGSSPDVLTSHIAAVTKRIRVGSGGVLLPQYSPYKVAETFKVMEALYPGRIDLGVGRSPGGGADTRLALTDGIRRSMNEFPGQLRDLQGFLTNTLPDNHPFREVKAYPDLQTLPELWLLGITERGARAAAENGMRFTYGHFITPANGEKAFQYYYRHFQPSAMQKGPSANVCVFVICAPTNEEAEHLAASQDHWLLDIEKGADTRIISPEEAQKRTLTAAEKEKIQHNRSRMVIGNPQKVRNQLLKISEKYGTDEIMAINNTYRFKDRARNLELLAELFL
ncbi:LLM class flavin-dependent oxidoreductase [Bacillus infantis]|uniref:LLM class flavin-dependent oxidoreductase n=1 Tax=Bacillus infantis TaxID=324767 RepID=UPI0039827F60